MSIQEINPPQTTPALPRFYFAVDFGVLQSSFQEVSGLDAGAQVIEYRQGDSKDFSTINMPGLRKTANITLKKGVFVKCDAFFDWLNQVKMNVVDRRTVIIKLLDEAGNTAMQWTLQNAWPTKITGTDLRSDGNELAIETVELACDGITVTS